MFREVGGGVLLRCWPAAGVDRPDSPITGVIEPGNGSGDSASLPARRTLFKHDYHMQCITLQIAGGAPILSTPDAAPDSALPPWCLVPSIATGQASLTSTWGLFDRQLKNSRASNGPAHHMPIGIGDCAREGCGSEATQSSWGAGGLRGASLAERSLGPAEAVGGAVQIQPQLLHETVQGAGAVSQTAVCVPSATATCPARPDADVPRHDDRAPARRCCTVLTVPVGGDALCPQFIASARSDGSILLMPFLFAPIMQWRAVGDVDAYARGAEPEWLAEMQAYQVLLRGHSARITFLAEISITSADGDLGALWRPSQPSPVHNHAALDQLTSSHAESSSEQTALELPQSMLQADTPRLPHHISIKHDAPTFLTLPDSGFSSSPPSNALRSAPETSQSPAESESCSADEPVLQTSTVMVSGCAAGRVCGWHIEGGGGENARQPRSVGKPCFSIHALDEGVWQVVAAPAGSPPPWNGFLVVVGEHSSVSLVDLSSASVTQVFSQSTPAQPLNLAWDVQRGFLALHSRLPDSQSAPAKQPGTASAPQTGSSLLQIWDLHSGVLDRTLTGSDADTMFETFLHCLVLHYPNSSCVTSHSSVPLRPRTPRARANSIDSRASSRSDLATWRSSNFGAAPELPQTLSRRTLESHLTHHDAGALPFSPHGTNRVLGGSLHVVLPTAGRRYVSAHPVEDAPLLHALPSPLPEVLLLDLHISSLMAADLRQQPESSASANGGLSDGTRPPVPPAQGPPKRTGDSGRALCVVLSLLHRWGIDAVADVKLARLLIGVNNPSLNSPSPSPTPRAGSGNSLLRFAEDVVLSSFGTIALQLPTRIREGAASEGQARHPWAESATRASAPAFGGMHPGATLRQHAQEAGVGLQERGSAAGNGTAARSDSQLEVSSREGALPGGRDASTSQPATEKVPERPSCGRLEVGRPSALDGSRSPSISPTRLRPPLSPSLHKRSASSPFLRACRSSKQLLSPTLLLPSAGNACQATAGYVWHASRGWLAVRLLFIVAVCRHLKTLDVAANAAAAAVSALTYLYTAQLTAPQLGGGVCPQGVPPLPAPALGVFVGSWSARLPAVKEASRLLMSSCTAPVQLSNAEYKAALAAGIAEQDHYHYRLLDVPSNALRDLASSSRRSPVGLHQPLSHLVACDDGAVPSEFEPLSSQSLERRDEAATSRLGTSGRASTVTTDSPTQSSSHSNLKSNMLLSLSAGIGKLKDARKHLSTALRQSPTTSPAAQSAASIPGRPATPPASPAPGPQPPSLQALREGSDDADVPPSPPAQVKLLPDEVIAILQRPPEAMPDPMQVLVSAAACAIHPRVVPPPMIALAVSQLLDLALTVPAPHSAAAASLLADMLHGPHAMRWKLHLGATSVLLHRVYAACLRIYNAANAVQAPPPGAPQPGAPAESRRHSTSATGGPVITTPAPISLAAWAKALPMRHKALILLPELRSTYYLRNYEQQNAPPPATLRTSKSRRSLGRMLSFYHTPPSAGGPGPRTPQSAVELAAADEVRAAAAVQKLEASSDPHDLANSCTSPVSQRHSQHFVPMQTDILRCRDILASLLSAVCSLDLSTFLHTFNTRIHIGHGQDANTPIHIVSLHALVSLLRSHHGALVVLHNLVVLCETITRLLDPAYASRRHRCLLSVVALMNELCMRFPMVAAHNPSSCFAVGCPEIMHPDPRVATVAAQSPITIYDMSTGLKTKVLVLSGLKSAGVNPVAPLAHTGNSSYMCGMAAIAFRKDGMALAAFSRISGFVYVWTLQPAWALRMSANPPSSSFSSLLGGGSHGSHVTHLQPFRVMAAPPQLLLDPNAQGTVSVDLSFSLVWADDGLSVMLKRGATNLGSIAVQCP